MKRLLFCLFIVALSFTACSKKEEIDHGAIAAQAAKVYYENLINGKYDQFLDGMNLPKKLPESYKKQMITNFKVFSEKQVEARKGITKVTINSAQFFPKDSTASVFLLLHYGDSTTEQVVVPMLKKNRLWYMR